MYNKITEKKQIISNNLKVDTKYFENDTTSRKLKYKYLIEIAGVYQVLFLIE